MNRPKLADYCIIADEYRYNEYVNDLEKYCDALSERYNALNERCNALEKELSETFNQHLESLIEVKDGKIVELEDLLEIANYELNKYKKALDKACNKLVEYCPSRNDDCSLREDNENECDECWKEWLLKDE